MQAKIIAGVATCEGRRQALYEMVRSIAPQVDEIHVYTNEVPVQTVVHTLNIISSRVKICVWGGVENNGDLGDAGKFWRVMTESGKVIYDKYAKPFYFIVLDDDLIYRPDFVESMVAAVNRYDRRAVVGPHGKLITPPVVSYYRNRGGIQWYHWRAAQKADVHVNLLGTGIMALYSTVVTDNALSYEHFAPLHNAADINFGAFCAHHQIPMICLSHNAHCVKLSPHINHATDTIYGRMRSHEKPLIDFINARRWPVSV